MMGDPTWEDRTMGEDDAKNRTEDRLERERQKASGDEHAAASGSGYTAGPSEEEPEDDASERADDDEG